MFPRLFFCLHFCKSLTKVAKPYLLKSKKEKKMKEKYLKAAQFYLERSIEKLEI